MNLAKKPLQVLVVDDDPSFLEILTSVLEVRGHQSIPCSNSEEAKYQWENHKLDLAILDYQMAGMNGVELCRWMRQQSKLNPDTYILIVTGHDSEELLKEFISANANDYLPKKALPTTIHIRLSFIEKQIAEIHAKQAAQHQYIQGEERFRLLSEKSRDLVCTHDQNQKITYASPSCENILGFTPEELVGQSFNELKHPEDEETVIWDADIQTANGNLALITQHRLRTKNGDNVWVETYTQPVQTSEGLEYYTYSREITQDKQDEDQLYALTHIEAKTDASEQIRTILRRISTCYEVECGLYVNPSVPGRKPYAICTSPEEKETILSIGDSLSSTLTESGNLLTPQGAANLYPQSPKLVENQIESLVLINVPRLLSIGTSLGILILHSKHKKPNLTKKTMNILGVAAAQIGCALEKVNLQ